MSYENQPYINEQQLRQEALQEGAHLLASNLVKVADEHGSEGIKSYLDDVLDQKQLGVSPAERMTAFDLLASEQEAITDIKTAEYGHLLLRGVEQANDEMKHSLQESKTILFKRIDEMKDPEAEPYVLTDNISDLLEYEDKFNRWLFIQDTLGDSFATEWVKAAANRRTLENYAQTLELDCIGVVEDDLPTISDESKDIITDDIQTVIDLAKVSGSSPQEAVVELIMQAKDGVNAEELNLIMEYFNNSNAEDTPKIGQLQKSVFELTNHFRLLFNDPDNVSALTVEQAIEVELELLCIGDQIVEFAEERYKILQEELAKIAQS